MTRTASCFFALSIGIALAAACGDDDGGDGAGGAGGGGGSGGAGASGGAAGSGGEAGSGDAGTGGTSAGTGGSSAGTAGSSAGTGGSSAGTAGTAGSNTGGAAGSGEEPDAGPDGSVEGDAGPDASVGGSAGTAGSAGTGGSGPVDSGINGDCADFATAAAAIVAQDNQEIVISRVIFNTTNDTAIVAFRAVDAPFNFATPMKICGGTSAGEDENCVDVQTLVDDELLPDILALNTEVTVTVEQVFPEGGEIVLGTNFPSEPAANTSAYIAWGEAFTSDAPTVGGGDAWETRAVEDGFWQATERVDPDNAENALILGGNPGDVTNNGNSSLADGFGVCTADQFF